MKLFMRNFYSADATRQEFKQPRDYAVLCRACAGKLGGKMLQDHKAAWRFSACGCCGTIKEVTKPHDFIWRP